MKIFTVVAAAVLSVQPQPALAQETNPAPNEALVNRLWAVLPDRHEIEAVGTTIDEQALKEMVVLNPGREAQVRTVLQANLSCSGPAIKSATLRMFASVARKIGEVGVQRLISFYEGPGYSTFVGLAARMDSNGSFNPQDSAAMNKIMEAYPIVAFSKEIARSEEIFAADETFMSVTKRCASERQAALDAAGLRSQ